MKLLCYINEIPVKNLSLNDFMFLLKVKLLVCRKKSLLIVTIDLVYKLSIVVN